MKRHEISVIVSLAASCLLVLAGVVPKGMSEDMLDNQIGACCFEECSYNDPPTECSTYSSECTGHIITVTLKTLADEGARRGTRLDGFSCTGSDLNCMDHRDEGCFSCP